MAKSVVLARELLRSGEESLKARWLRLRAFESRNPLQEMRGSYWRGPNRARPPSGRALHPAGYVHDVAAVDSA